MENEFEKIWKSRLGRILFIVGAVLFIMAGTFTLIHLGMQLDASVPSPMKPFSTISQMWIVNGILGIVGGVLMNYRRFLIAAICGLVGTLGITGATLLYMTWRESILKIEIALPLILGIIPAILLYKALTKNSATGNKPV